jgi:hypothetical protein
LAASRLTLPLLLLATVGVGACAGPKPVLYPNRHLEAVGQERAERDIAECQELAQSAGARGAPSRGARTAGNTAVGGAAGAATGAVGGAVVGSPGTGAAVGAATGATAGLLRSIFTSGGPSGAYQAFVDRCLRERGYEPVGWD